MSLEDGPDFFVWSLNLPEAARRFAAAHRIPVYHVEDGFIRSAVLQAGRTPPLSLIVDSRTPYFDSRQPSDLEVILSTYDFEADPALMDRAASAIEMLRRGGIGKYNSGELAGRPIYPAKTRRRVLVLGQVDGDASIRYGAARPITNDALVRLAAADNPDAEIIYKPHPDVLAGVRSSRARLDELARIATILRVRSPLAQALETIDHVYSMTSLGGFEALLRGIPVTVTGLPFYAGWGLTDDRHDNLRRTRRLTLTQVFAGAYLLYPLYFEPETGARTSFEDVIRTLYRPLAPAFQSEESRVSRRKALGLFGWRRSFLPLVSSLVGRVGTEEDARYFEAFPADFFQERPEAALRRIGALLFPPGRLGP
ncbi:capsular polysaccharide biosynthesis protein [Rhizobium sp. YIM 134829]|uniref:capsular polysaccharide export protein, LipB/KpsS family n=1 Tax=Rhizobium sp. YIM 134829 TaxID=3390453 RepID=UPI00397A0462